MLFFIGVDGPARSEGSLGARITQVKMLYPTASMCKSTLLSKGGYKSRIRVNMILQSKPQDVVKLHLSFYFV